MSLTYGEQFISVHLDEPPVTPVYVLTRTSARPHFFHENYLSVKSQTYPEVRQIVSYDDESTGEYVAKYPDIASVRVEKIPRRGGNHFPYNLYLNILLREIDRLGWPPGWVLFLDDDDVLTSPRSIELMVAAVKNEQSLVQWQVEFPNNRRVPKRLGHPPRFGDISMIGFMFHSQWIKQVKFDDRKGGDYRISQQLWSFLLPVWIDQVLTKINYQSPRRLGSGQRNDLKMSAVQFEQYKLFLSNITNMPKNLKLNLTRKTPGQETEDVVRSKTLVLDEDSDYEGGTESQEFHDSLLGVEDDDAVAEPTDDPEVAEDDAEAEADAYTDADADADADDDDVALHPQIERLLNLLEDQSKVQIFNAGELKSVVHESVKDIFQTSNLLQDMVKDCLREVLDEAITKKSSGPPPVASSKTTVAKRSQVRPMTKTSVKRLDNSPEKQLNDLLEKESQRDNEPEERKLTNLLSGYAESASPRGEVPEFTQIDQFFDQVYIMNLAGKASELQHRLMEAGFTKIQVYDGNNKKSFWDNLWDIAKQAQKKGYRTFAVLQDNIHLNKKFAFELLAHFEGIKSKEWKLIAFSASQNLTTKAGLDWKFYLDTYPDLKKNRITNEVSAQKHWRTYGTREKRYSQRGMLHPDTLGGVSGVFLSDLIYQDIPKLQKARHASEFLIKNYKPKVYAVSPLLGLSAINRMVRHRNKHNLGFYDFN